jgi:hypothetical protein
MSPEVPESPPEANQPTTSIVTSVAAAPFQTWMESEESTGTIANAEVVPPVVTSDGTAGLSGPGPALRSVAPAGLTAVRVTATAKTFDDGIPPCPATWITLFAPTARGAAANPLPVRLEAILFGPAKG